MEIVAPTRRAFAGSLVAGLGAFLLLQAPLGAQQIPGQDVPGDEEIQELFEEFQEKSQRFEALHTEAMEGNEQLRVQEEELHEKLNQAMLEIEPGFQEGMERLTELQTEMMQAQAEQDEEAAQAIVMEAQEIEGRLNRAQAEAMERPEIQQEMENFQDNVMDELTRLDPEAEELLERLEELAQILEALQAQMGPGPGR